VAAPFCRAVAEADDPNAREQAHIALLNLVRTAMPLLVPPRRRPRAIASVAVDAASGAELAAAAPSANEHDDDPVAARCRHATRIFLGGGARAMHRAVRALTQQPCADPSDPAVADALRLLHPPPVPGAPDPLFPVLDPAESSAMEIRVSAGVLSRAVKAAATYAAPGLSGWTAEHILYLLDGEAGQCQPGVAAFVDDIRLNRVSRRVADYLKAAVLLPATKKGSVTNIRPIAMGETWLKIAAAVQLQSIMSPPPPSRSAAPELFGNIQLGAGAPGGSEAALHAVQLQVNATSGLPPASRQDIVTVSLDVKNAFNSLDRGLIAAALQAQPRTKPLWPIAKLAYSSPSTLYLFNRTGECVSTVLSQRGVRQGDVLGSFLFALAMQPAYQDCANVPGVRGVVAVLDDLTVTGHVDALERALQRLQAFFARAGLSLNAEKSLLLPHHADNGKVSSAVAAFATAHGFTVQTGGAMRTLGSVVGTSNAAMAAELESMLRDKHGPLFAALSHAALPRQLALHFLRSSGLPRMNYLCRTLPPEVVNGAASRFDERVHATLRALIALDPTRLPDMGGNTRRQTELNVRSGGLGLRPARRVSAAAYVSALAVALRVCSNHALDSLPDSPVFQSLAQALRSLEADGCKACAKAPVLRRPGSVSGAALGDAGTIVLPSFDVVEFVSHHSAIAAGQAGEPRARYQHQLTKQLDERAAETLLDASTPRERARIRAAADKHASRWLTVAPTHRRYILDNFTFSQAVRLRVGLPPIDATRTSPLRCECGAALTADNHDHFLLCRTIGKSGWLARHNNVAGVIAKLAQETGMLVDVEARPPRRPGRPDQHRPDLLIAGVGLFDVAVTTPTSRTHVAAGSGEDPSRPLNTVAKRKVAKYAALAIRFGVTFGPLAFSSYGGFHKGVVQLINTIADFGATSASRVGDAWVIGAESASTRTLAAHFTSMLSFALQRGNALLLRLALKRSPVYRFSAAAGS
jgi:hypothetical protein